MKTKMEGLIASHKRITAGNVSPMIHAAIVAYGLASPHPFADGNGRIHGSLAARTRSTHFDFPTDEELSAMEQVVTDGPRPE
ncbi:MAG: Fic family protein [Deltaproteobacteria bacterium]|nr:Fic family protein [Candidatus Anaeroferrophillacea bacterium]